MCFKGFGSPYAMRFQCDECQRGYQTKDSLVRHKRLECGKPHLFHCSKCSYSTHYGSRLNNHIASKGHA